MVADGTKSQDPSEAWRALLEQPGHYEHQCASVADLRRIRKLGLAWRRVLQHVQLPPGARVFELGCGGGKHLAALGLRGYRVHGVDVSPEVVARARDYLGAVAGFAGIDATVEVANFLEYDVLSSASSFDMCFHAGVVEHFLDPAQRALIWQKMHGMLRPGGWVVSLVPNGKHIVRQRLRDHGLMGYHVPEIDYGCELHSRELVAAGFEQVVCLPHNYLAFLPAHPSRLLSGPLARPLFYAANAALPWIPVSPLWKERYASTLIAIGRRPGSSGERKL